MNINSKTIFVCKTCDTEFTSRKACKTRIPEYCSKPCYAESLKINQPCLECGNVIEGRNESVTRRKYCSRGCFQVANSRKPVSEETKKKQSIARLNNPKCKKENLYNWKGGKSTLALRSKVNQQKRRSKIKLPIDKAFLFSLFVAQKKKCFYCETDISKDRALEHLTSIHYGGDNQEYNLVYSCKSCNSKKRHWNLEEYAIKNNRIDWCNKWEDIYISALIIRDKIKEWNTSRPQSL